MCGREICLCLDNTTSSIYFFEKCFLNCSALFLQKNVTTVLVIKNSSLGQTKRAEHHWRGRTFMSWRTWSLTVYCTCFSQFGQYPWRETTQLAGLMPLCSLGSPMLALPHFPFPFGTGSQASVDLTFSVSIPRKGRVQDGTTHIFGVLMPLVINFLSRCLSIFGRSYILGHPH